MLSRCARNRRFVVAGLVFFAACSSSTEANPPSAITVVSGNAQTGAVGSVLAKPLVVRVTAADGAKLVGQTVDFAVTAGQATLNPPSATTDTAGLAQTSVTLGTTGGSVEITATVRGTTLSTKFTAVAQAVVSSFNCTGVTPLNLAIGETQTSLSGSGACLNTSTSAEYLVHAFHATTVATSQTQVGIAGFNITTVTTANGVSANIAPTSVLLPGSSAIGMASTSLASDPARALHSRLRAMERTELRSKMAGARLAMRQRGALRTAAVPAEGDILQLNVNEGCNAAPRFRPGRVVAVTSAAIVVADTGNPAGGFSDAEYRSLGVNFDTLVDPLDQAAFGAPTDIDANGRIIIFSTRAVNELTPAGSNGFVEGFFNPRDIFPKTASSTVPQGCTGSNVAEMFYVLAPDPNGTINNNKHSKDEVQRFAVDVLAHEYQHLINGSRRLYVNFADFEEVWLNEGLSHIAEELLFYRAAGLGIRQNLDGPTIASNQRSVDSFNQNIAGDFGLYLAFNASPMMNTPYGDADSVATRGAIWNFLRFAADHQGSNDGTIWFQLANSKTTGFQNLINVFGPNPLNKFRDWSISVFIDDYTAANAAFQQPSWNFRSIYPRVGIPNFPLKLFLLSNGNQITQTLVGGGSLYTRLAVQANTTAAISWSVATPNVQISIVRTK